MSNGKKGNKKFSKQDLTKADMHGQNLRFADFRGAILVEANLSEADLTEADLREADLKGADLRKANMQGAFIRDANLRGADLSSAINLAAIDVDSSYTKICCMDLRSLIKDQPSVLSKRGSVKSRSSWTCLGNGAGRRCNSSFQFSHSGHWLSGNEGLSHQQLPGGNRHTKRACEKEADC